MYQTNYEITSIQLVSRFLSNYYISEPHTNTYTYAHIYTRTHTCPHKQAQTHTNTLLNEIKGSCLQVNNLARILLNCCVEKLFKLF